MNIIICYDFKAIFKTIFVFCICLEPKLCDIFILVVIVIYLLIIINISYYYT